MKPIDYINKNKNYRGRYVKYKNIYVDDKKNSEMKNLSERINKLKFGAGSINNTNIENIKEENEKKDKLKDELKKLNEEEKELYKNKCIELCSESEDCDGLNIDKDNSCGIIKKISRKNMLEKDNTTVYVKDEIVKKYKDDKKEEYLIKLNDGNYLSSEEQYGISQVIPTENIKKADKYVFSEDGTIIEKKSSKCLQNNGMYYILNKCNPGSDKQKFIVEDKLNTLRNSENNCLTKNGDRITHGECYNSLLKNNPQSVFLESVKSENNGESELIKKEEEFTNNDKYSPESELINKRFDVWKIFMVVVCALILIIVFLIMISLEV